MGTRLKKMKKLILIFFWTIIVLSCTSTKKTTEITTVAKTNTIGITSTSSKDTTHTVTNIIYLPFKSGFDITQPCDSLGNLRDVNFLTSSGNFTAKITSLNNTLHISFSQIDTLKSTIDNLIISNHKKDSLNQVLTSKIESKKDSKKVIYKPTKWTYIFFGAFVVVLYMLLSKWRKLIPTIF